MHVVNGENAHNMLSRHNYEIMHLLAFIATEQLSRRKKKRERD
jgi:hypothetical protein